MPLALITACNRKQVREQRNIIKEPVKTHL